MLRTTYLHSGWKFVDQAWLGEKAEYGEMPGWLSAQVPGHVHLDLMHHGIIADPFVGMAELGCQWVDERDWSYRTTFKWQPDPENPRRVLHFEGLDTICEVFLNDEKVADHDNMFLPLEVDVTEKLVVGTNTLRIDFQSAVRIGKERRRAFFEKEGLPLDTSCFHERAFVRKAQYMFGWDWGPRLVSCGVWKPVKLIEFEARVTDIYAEVSTLPDEDGEGRAVRLRTGCEGEADVVSRFYAFGTFKGQDATLNLDYWASSLILETALFAGQAPEIETKGDREGKDMTQGALDYRETNIGFDKVRLLQEPDQYGQSFEFEVNGDKIWIKGANWIPDHSFPSTVTRSQLRDKLQKCKDMGFNMLRVWGGGLYESDDFYELCDELGILVWQDFPFACGYYPDDEASLEVYRKEAEYHVRRLRNHPCLALWSGNNEVEMLHHGHWAGDKGPPRFYGEKAFHDVLREVVQRLDPKTPYIATSPIGRPGDSDPNCGGVGNQHCWDVWHGRGDWKHYSESTARFSSEYGFASSCSLAAWEKVLGTNAEDYPFDLNDPVLRWHDKTRKGAETFVDYVRLHYPKPKTLADWVYYSQLNQRDALRHGVEHYRRSAFCRGSLIWQLNDCWPVQSWSIIDSEGNQKALAYELRRFYGKSLISIERYQDQVKVHLINDGEGDTFEVSLDAYDIANGKLLANLGETRMDMKEDSRAVVLEASVKGLSVPETILVATDKSNCLTSWMLLSEPKDARFAEPAPIYASLREEGYLTLQVDQPVVDLMLTDRNDVASFTDANFLTMPLGGKVILEYTGSGEGLKARSLAGWHVVNITRSPI